MYESIENYKEKRTGYSGREEFKTWNISILSLFIVRSQKSFLKKQRINYTM